MFQPSVLLAVGAIIKVTVAADANGTESIEYAPPWVTPPSGRGSWTIIYSCVLTLFLCAYSMIHHNIPPRDETLFNSISRSVSWGTGSLVAPEITLFFAVSQFVEARRLRGRLNGVVEEWNGKVRAEKEKGEGGDVVCVFSDGGGGRLCG